MSKKYGTFSSILLAAVGESTGLFSWPIEGSYEWLKQQRKTRKDIYDSLYQLKKRGFIKESSKNGKRFFKLTKKGQIEMFFEKANVSFEKGIWDGKWRIVMFDIPEEASHTRDKLRRLLKQNHFVKLQASIFISPYGLNRDAINYLKESGLINYIRLARIDEMDDDQDLQKKFKLL